MTVITEYDLDFSKFTWEVYKNMSEFSESQLTQVENIFAGYIKKVQEYKTGQDISQVFHDTIVSRPVSVFSMYGKTDTYELWDSKMTAVSDKEIKQEKTKLEKIKGFKKSLLETDKKQNTNCTDEILKLLAVQNTQLLAQITATSEALSNFAENVSGNQKIAEMNFIKIGEQNKQMAKDIQKLYDLQLRKESILDVKWDDLPRWFHEIYAQGVKKVAVHVAKLPIRIAGILIDRVIYRPMVRAYEFWGGHVELVVGSIWWIIVIAGVVHVYQITDWDKVNRIYNTYGGDVINKYTFSVVNTAPDIIRNFAPSAVDMLNSFRSFVTINVVVPIFHVIYNFFQLISGLLTISANYIFSRLPLAHIWFTPMNINFPDTPFYKAIIEYFL